MVAKPAMVLLAPGGDEVWRFVSRDFADRLPEDEVADRIAGMDLASVDPWPLTIGPREPGVNAIARDDLPVYFRGAKFAAMAMGLRHRHESDAIKDDSKTFVALMDEYLEHLA